MGSSYGPSSYLSPLGSLRTFASKKHKRVIKLARGYKGRANRVFSVAIQRVEKALQHAYVGRKLKKRDARRNWIVGMNAGLRAHGTRYGEFIGMQKESGCRVNRKVLAGLAEWEPFSFKAVLDVVKMKAKEKGGK